MHIINYSSIIYNLGQTFITKLLVNKTKFDN